jgi:hypothetical protein
LLVTSQVVFELARKGVGLDVVMEVVVVAAVEELRSSVREISTLP